MSHFNLLEAKVDFNGKNVLEVEAQLKRLLIPPYSNVLISNVKSAEGIDPPCERGKFYSLNEFTSRIYMWHFSLTHNDLTYPNTEIKINIKQVNSIDD